MATEDRGIASLYRTICSINIERFWSASSQVLRRASPVFATAVLTSIFLNNEPESLFNDPLTYTWADPELFLMGIRFDQITVLSLRIRKDRLEETV